MTKPDWKKAPKWARYVAQDVDGRWAWFENKPDASDSLWGGMWDAQGGKFKDTIKTRPAWKDTLEKRTEEAGR